MISTQFKDTAFLISVLFVSYKPHTACYINIRARVSDFNLPFTHKPIPGFLSTVTCTQRIDIRNYSPTAFVSHGLLLHSVTKCRSRWVGILLSTGLHHPA
jgi:hypothetical protein